MRRNCGLFTASQQKRGGALTPVTMRGMPSFGKDAWPRRGGGKERRAADEQSEPYGPSMPTVCARPAGATFWCGGGAFPIHVGDGKSGLDKQDSVTELRRAAAFLWRRCSSASAKASGRREQGACAGLCAGLANRLRAGIWRTPAGTQDGPASGVERAPPHSVVVVGGSAGCALLSSAARDSGLRSCAIGGRPGRDLAARHASKR